MTEAEWLAATDPQPMLEFLLRSGRVNPRKLQLFGVACVRRLWPQFADERSRTAIEVAERFVEGRAEIRELNKASEDVLALQQAVGRVPPGGTRIGWWARLTGSWLATLRGTMRDWFRGYVPLYLIWYLRSGPEADFPDIAMLVGMAADFHPDGSELQASILREIVGNPFHPPPAVDPGILAWNSGAVPTLARSVYDDRTFGRLPVLADALEDAGCTDAELLGHLRRSGNHVRGCWAVDLLVDKV
jgi:hypothetical protein